MSWYQCHWMVLIGSPLTLHPDAVLGQRRYCYRQDPALWVTKSIEVGDMCNKYDSRGSYSVHFQRFKQMTCSPITDMIKAHIQCCECLRSSKSETVWYVLQPLFLLCSHSTLRQDTVLPHHRYHYDKDPVLWVSEIIEVNDSVIHITVMVSTWFTINAPARCRAPSAPISLTWRLSFLSVWDHSCE